MKLWTTKGGAALVATAGVIFGLSATVVAAPAAEGGALPRIEGATPKPEQGAKPEDQKAKEEKAKADKEARQKAAKEKAEQARAERQKAAQERQQAKGPDAGRPLAPDTPQAFALSKLLRAPSHYAKDGTVRLAYDFTDPDLYADWDAAGFAALEGRAGPVWQKHRLANKKPTHLALSVSSSGRGWFLHKLALGASYELRFELTVDRMSSTSDLCFVVGGAALRFGAQPLAHQRGRLSALRDARLDPAAREAFAGGGRVSVRLVVRDGELTGYVNGKQVAQTRRLSERLDGRFGLYCAGLNLKLFRCEVLGALDATKL
ncbi:MAG: hypothetical protein AB7N76_19725 [Planctomycetota bacterium]